MTRFFTACLLLVFQPVFAKPVLLSCTSSTGANPRVEIDLDANTGMFGSIPYVVTSADGDLVTMTMRDKQSVGGEIFVIDRGTGEWRRVSIHIECLDSNCVAKQLDSVEQHGTCQKKLF